MKITFAVGRLTREPVRARTSDYPRAYATIAAKVVSINGEHTTEFVDLIIDGHLATTMLAHGHKGDSLYVVGREHLKEYTHRESGKTGHTNEIYVLDFDFAIAPKRTQ
jgi:single-stranded DNA-binding protein